MIRHPLLRFRFVRHGAVALRLAALLLGLCAASAQELETERWRVPMRVDRRDVATDLILEFSFERLEAPLVELGEADDPDRSSMLRFADSLAQGEVDLAMDLTAIAPGSSPDDNRELLTAFSNMLSEAAELMQIERVVHLGPDRLLVWSLPIEDDTRYFRSFRFVRDDQGELRYEGVASEPVSSLLTYAFQVGQDQGPDPREPDAFDYEYTLPATEEQPVRFRFDGVELEVDAFNPLGETGYPPVDFFNTAIDRLAHGSPEEYAQFFSDFSEGRYVNWAAEQGDEAYEAYRSEMAQYGARVVFVLEAQPMYLVFYLPTDPAVQGAPLKYMALYDNPESGFELTNFYVHGLADSVLQRREYFEEPFLRPLLASAGLIPEQPGPERVVVSAGETLPPDPDEILATLDEQARSQAAQEQPEQPLPEDIDALASDSLLWPWILAAALLLVLALYAFSRRK